MSAKRGLMLGAICALAALTAAAAAAAADNLYSDKYDYVDVDEILNNKRKLDQYYSCFLDIAPCYSPDAKFFKDIFPEAIVTKCKRCTDKQRDSLEKIVLHLTEKEPEKWKDIFNRAIEKFQKKKV